MKGDGAEVLAGSSLLDHPIEFICARKDSAAMTTKLEGRRRDRYGRCARRVDDFRRMATGTGPEAGGELGEKKEKN